MGSISDAKNLNGKFVEDSLEMKLPKFGVNWNKNVGGDGHFAVFAKSRAMDFKTATK